MWVRSLGQDDSPGRGNGNPQYSCLENSVDGGAWRAAVYGVTESDTTAEAKHCCTYIVTIFVLNSNVSYKEI